jgi:hypothetical protein
MLEKYCVENNNDNDHSLGLKAVLPWGCASAALMRANAAGGIALA